MVLVLMFLSHLFVLADERKIVARVSEHTGLTLQCDEGEYVWTEDVPDISPDALDNLDEACFISNGEKTAELHLGSKKITIDSGDHAFSFSIRPDIRAETVLNLIQQVSFNFMLLLLLLLFPFLNAGDDEMLDR